MLLLRELYLIISSDVNLPVYRLCAHSNQFSRQVKRRALNLTTIGFVFEMTPRSKTVPAVRRTEAVNIASS